MINENSTVKELIAALFKAADKLDAQSKTEYWLRERAGELRNAAWEIKEFIAAQDEY